MAAYKHNKPQKPHSHAWLWVIITVQALLTLFMVYVALHCSKPIECKNIMHHKTERICEVYLDEE